MTSEAARPCEPHSTSPTTTSTPPRPTTSSSAPVCLHKGMFGASSAHGTSLEMQMYFTLAYHQPLVVGPCSRSSQLCIPASPRRSTPLAGLAPPGLKYYSMQGDTRSILEAFLVPVSSFSASPGPRTLTPMHHPHNSESNPGSIVHPTSPFNKTSSVCWIREFGPLRPQPTRGIADDVISANAIHSYRPDGRRETRSRVLKADDLTDDFFLLLSFLSLWDFVPPPARMDEAPSCLPCLPSNVL